MLHIWRRRYPVGSWTLKTFIPLRLGWLFNPLHGFVPTPWNRGRYRWIFICDPSLVVKKQPGRIGKCVKKSFSLLSWKRNSPLNLITEEVHWINVGWAPVFIKIHGRPIAWARGRHLIRIYRSRRQFRYPLNDSPPAQSLSIKSFSSPAYAIAWKLFVT